GQEDEVVDCDRRLVGEQLDHDVALLGLKRGHVNFVRVNRHRGRGGGLLAAAAAEGGRLRRLRGEWRLGRQRRRGGRRQDQARRRGGGCSAAGAGREGGQQQPQGYQIGSKLHKTLPSRNKTSHSSRHRMTCYG